MAIDLFLDRDQGSINEYAYILRQNNLKLYSSIDFTPIGWFFEKKSNKKSKTKKFK